MMTVQKGLVKYKNRSDLLCTYGTNESGINYYFLKELDNKNIIVSTELVEAIDEAVLKVHVGMINDEGKELIPMIHKNITLINEDTMLLLERAEAIDPNVLAALSLSDEENINNENLIKSQINTLSPDISYLYENQKGEASITDLDGNNLIGGEYYSYIALIPNDGIYLSKNVPNSPILKLSFNEEAPVSNEGEYRQEDIPGEEVQSDISVEENPVNIEENMDNQFNISEDVSVPEIDNNDFSNNIEVSEVQENVEVPENFEQEEQVSDFNYDGEQQLEIPGVSEEFVQQEEVSNFENVVDENDYVNDSSNDEVDTSVFSEAAELVRKLTEAARELQAENERLKQELNSKEEKLNKFMESKAEIIRVIDSAEEFLNNK